MTAARVGDRGGLQDHQRRAFTGVMTMTPSR